MISMNKNKQSKKFNVFGTLIISAIVFMSQCSRADLKVMYPQSLADEIQVDGAVRGSLANFGHIEYGSSYIGQVLKPFNNTNGCDPLSWNQFDKSVQSDPADQSISTVYFVMLNRGGCTFTQKVRNVENFGGKVALIENYQTSDKIQNQIMSDDGNGFSLKTPSFLVRQQDAAKIEKALAKNDKVVFKVSLDIYHPDNRVEYELWYATSLDLRADVMLDFLQFQRSLDESAFFTPRIHTFSCPTCPDFIKKKDCYSNGKFCAFAPQIPQTGANEELTGRQLLEEDLREKCIYNHLQAANATHYEAYFQYMYKFLNKCAAQEEFNKACSIDTMKSVGIDFTAIQTCFTKSFNKPGNFESMNHVLQKDREWADLNGLAWHPAVTINNYTYRGDFDGEDIFNAVCAGFQKKPEQCFKGYHQHMKIDDDFNVHIRDRRGDYHGGHLFLAISVVILVNVCGFLIARKLFKRNINRRMQSQVNQQVQQYFALASTDQQKTEV